ncbi:MAG: polyhydroxyalkanoate synthesis regulator DNA-binding domain-containing protein [Pirellulales bacterium]
MPEERLLIKRYPNRRFYARHLSKYVTLEEIEQLIDDGRTVEIRDSQTGKDLTRAVLAQIIMERQPEKMALFPSAMLHSIVRANDLMSDFLKGYFRDSLTYLEYLQQHGSANPMAQPTHWIKAWFEGLGAAPGERSSPAATSAADAGELPQRVEELEQRIRELEAAAAGKQTPAGTGDELR